MALAGMRWTVSPAPLSEQLWAGGLTATSDVFAADPPAFGARGIAYVWVVMVVLCRRPT